MFIHLTQWSNGEPITVNVHQIAYYRPHEGGAPPCTALYIDRADNVLLVRERYQQIDDLIIKARDFDRRNGWTA